jgi:hypothetical protein
MDRANRRNASFSGREMLRWYRVVSDEAAVDRTAFSSRPETNEDPESSRYKYFPMEKLALAKVHF